MFIIYNPDIFCIEYVQVNIHTHTHIVRVLFWLVFLCLECLHFATSQSALQEIPLVSFIIGISMFSHVRCTAFSSYGRFAFAFEIPFQSPGAPNAFIVLPFPLPEDT